MLPPEQTAALAAATTALATANTNMTTAAAAYLAKRKADAGR